VEPHRRLLMHIRMLPRFPRVVSLRFSSDESPLIAPTRSSFAIGKTVSNVLPTERAIYSVQITGRLFFFSQLISALKFSGHE